MLFNAKPINKTLRCFWGLGNVLSGYQSVQYGIQACNGYGSDDNIWPIVDAIDCAVGVIPGYGTALMSLFCSSDHIKNHIEIMTPIYSSNPYFCPLR